MESPLFTRQTPWIKRELPKGEYGEKILKVSNKGAWLRGAKLEREEKLQDDGPDLNPIENIFHIVSRKLEKDAIDQRITPESYQEYSISHQLIDKTIESMNTRIANIIMVKD